MLHPDRGDVIPGTGGIGKMRWATNNKGETAAKLRIFAFSSRKRPFENRKSYSNSFSDRKKGFDDEMKQKDSLIRALKGKRGGTRVLYFYKEHEMVRPKKTDDTITPLGQELIEAAEAMLAHSRGEEWTKDFKSTIYTVPDRVDVKKIRTSMHLTQEQFAHFIGASVHAVRHWENGRRTPDGTARTLLCVLQSNPHAVLDALGQPKASVFLQDHR